MNKPKMENQESKICVRVYINFIIKHKCRLIHIHFLVTCYDNKTKRLPECLISSNYFNEQAKNK